jgi:hypothetical protein
MAGIVMPMIFLVFTISIKSRRRKSITLMLLNTIEKNSSAKSNQVFCSRLLKIKCLTFRPVGVI